jgi:hypothetical protein
MDFSSDVLIEFGLNLAGYIIAALLIYLLLGMRKQRAEQMERHEDAAPSKTKAEISKQKTFPAAAINRDVEFVPLSKARTGNDDSSEDKSPEKTDADVEDTAQPAVISRQASRRAIYQEARRLLASGKPHSDLLEQLPLTEGELEMLTVAGKA